MREHHLRVQRTARFYVLGPERGPPAELWFVLHGYRQLAGRFLTRFRGIDDGSRLIVAPEALSRFYLDDNGGPHGPDAAVGATWMTREDRLNEIRDYVDYLDRLLEHVRATYQTGDVAIHLLGFSQGAATAARWASFGRARIDSLTLWAGGLPPDLDLAQVATTLRRLRITYLFGDRDEVATPERIAAEQRRLRDVDVPHHLLPFRGGHRIEPLPLERLAHDLATLRRASSR